MSKKSYFYSEFSPYSTLLSGGQATKVTLFYNNARKNEPLHPKVKEIANGSFRRLEPPDIKGSGYVIKSLEAALWAFHNAPDFRTAVLKAVNLGDDADTTGAVCGQLAGAYWGESGIPDEWLEGLARRDMIEKALDGLITDESAAETLSPVFRLSLASTIGNATFKPGIAVDHIHNSLARVLLYEPFKLYENDEDAAEEKGNWISRSDFSPS